MRNIPSQLFQALDERELTALIPLAFEELLESRGAKRELLDVLIAATSSGAEGETKHLEQLATLLELSPQGKALLQPRPEVRDTPAQGTILDVHFATTAAICSLSTSSLTIAVPSACRRRNDSSAALNVVSSSRRSL